MGKPPPRSPYIIPAWFPDPDDPRREWYWDGTDYTEQRVRKKTPEPSGDRPAKVRPARKMPKIYWSNFTITKLFGSLFVGVLLIIVLGSVLSSALFPDVGDWYAALLGTLTLIAWPFIFVAALMVDPDDIKCAKCGKKYKEGYDTCAACGNTKAATK